MEKVSQLGHTVISTNATSSSSWEGLGKKVMFSLCKLSLASGVTACLNHGLVLPVHVADGKLFEDF